jgi:hypothetical protein
MSVAAFPKTLLSQVAFWFCACNGFAMAVFSQGVQNRRAPRSRFFPTFTPPRAAHFTR